MKNFNLQRFGRVVRRDVLGNYRQNLRLLAGSYICNLILEVVVYVKPSRVGLPDLPFGEAILTERIIGMATGFLFLVFIAGTASTFTNLSSKQKRIAELTLPATNAERFWARLLHSLVLWPAAFCVSFVFADLTRMLVFPVLGHAFPTTIPEFMTKLGHFFTDSWQLLAGGGDGAPLNFHSPYDGIWSFFLLWGFIVALHSFYLLGGVLFRRRPVIYTTLILVTACILLGVSVTHENLKVLTVSAEMEELSAKIFIVLQWIFAIACYSFGYYRYKRITVIPRKILRK